MHQKKLLFTIFIQTFNSFQKYFAPLFGLFLTLFLQILVPSTTILLAFYLGGNWLWPSLLILPVTLIIAMSLVGFGKNLNAISKQRLQKYPLWDLTYITQGLKIFSFFLLNFCLPFSLIIFSFVCGTIIGSQTLLIFSIISLFFAIIWQLRFGMAGILLLSGETKFSSSLVQSWKFTGQHLEICSILLIFNFTIFIVLSLFLPFFGTILGLIWCLLASVLLSQKTSDCF